jgi:hypothetical protein
MAQEKKLKKVVPLRGIISEEVGDHSNDPFVLKKVDAAKKRLERIQLPKELVKKK